MTQNANNLLECGDSTESLMYLTWSFITMRWLERVKNPLGGFSNLGKNEFPIAPLSRFNWFGQDSVDSTRQVETRSEFKKIC